MKDRDKRLAWIGLIAGLVVTWPGAGWAQTTSTWQLGDIELHRCELAQANSAATVAAWCGTLAVPENRDRPRDRMIDLHLAVLRSRVREAAKDVVTLLAGGPGQAATASYHAEAAGLKGLRDKRHILLVDQRGTGQSNALSCRQTNADRPLAFDLQAIARDTRDCLDRVSDDADPRFYTTTAAVADLEAVRAALGIRQLDLVGVSYGTRVAQQYARAHADRTRALVLDGVVPNSVYLGQNMARHLDAALRDIFDRCRQNGACADHLGDPRVTLDRLRKRLSHEPVGVSYRDPQTSARRRDRLTDDKLISVVRLFAYTPETAALLPLALDRAAQGDPASLMAQAAMIDDDLSASMSTGMGLSVLCSEDAAQLSPTAANVDTVLGNRLIQAFKAQCGIWPRGSMPTDFHEPLQSDIPTLLISGAVDPVTPPSYAEKTARSLAQSRSVVLPGAGHNNLMRGCTPRIVMNFIAELAPENLDTDCLERLQAPPIFVGTNGARP